MHDPGTVTKDGDTYFNFTTGTGIWYSTSPDLVTWSGGPGPVFATYPSWIANKIPNFSGSFWAEINQSTGKLATSATTIWGGGGRDIEAPYSQGVDSTYYVEVQRATSVTGPYSGTRTILPNLDANFKGPGHVGVLKQDGCNFVSTHYYDLNDGGKAKLEFHKMTYSGGWPVMTRSFPSFAGCGGISDGSYAFKSRLSGKVLTVAGASTADGALVQQASDTGARHQSWYVIGHGDGYYSIINGNSLRSLDDYNNSTTAGTNIAQWGYWAGNGQQWRFASPAAGYQTVANLLSGMVLDVKGKSLDENAQIIQYTLNNGSNQQWSLQRR